MTLAIEEIGAWAATSRAARWEALAPGFRSVPEPPRFTFGDFTAAMAGHFFGQHEVWPVGCWRIEGGAVAGDGVPVRDGTALRCRELNLHEANTAGHLRGPVPQPRRIAGQVALLPGPGHAIFGHWLLDFLPKLRALDRLGLDLAALRFPLPADTPPFAAALLRLVGIGEHQLLRYDPERESVRADELIVPTLLRSNSRAHPALGDAAAFLAGRIAPDAAADGPPRLLLSRARAGRDGRRVANRPAIEAAAAAAGFAVVHPETLPLVRQVALLRGARQVVGEYGSQLHATIFASPGTVVCALRGTSHHPGFLQSGLGEVLRQPTGYVFGRSEPDAIEQAFAIDPADLARALGCMDRCASGGP